MSIKIETGAVKTAASKIARNNQIISNKFSSVDNIVSGMNKNWQGTVSNAAIIKFRQLKQTYGEARFNVINDMVNFMYQQVGEGYENTETSVQSAASAFK